MKATHKLLALALMAVAIVFTSCSKDDDGPVVPTQQEIEAKIVGKWKYVETRGRETLTNERSIITYLGGGKESASLAKTHEVVGFVWSNKEQYSYQVKDNRLTETRLSNGQNLYTDILSIDNNRLEKVLTRVVYPDGKTSELNQSMVFSKITPNNYANDIIGMWEGVSMTGDETYGNAEARIAYHADGTFTYYRKYADVWYPSDDVSSEYNVDGDWLATRWQAEEGGEYNYEWWDIDEIKDGIMKWSALRERADGSRYTTTFTWKKVNVLMDDELRAKVMGDWKAMGATSYYFKEGKFVGKEDYSPVPGQTISVTEDNMFHIINIDEDGQPYAIGGWNFTIKGNVVTTVLTECPYPNLIGQTHRYVWFFMEGDTFYFAIYDDEDDPDYDHSLFVSRYQR